MKILCDQMLGSLATWLRFFGCDTFFVTDQLSDDDLLKIAKDENRILITKDKELINRAKKRDVTVIPIQSLDLDQQLMMVTSMKSFDKDHVLTRCSLCNSLLDSIGKEEIKDKVPGKIYQYQDKFWFCSKCQKIYWKGSHYDNILKKIKALK